MPRFALVILAIPILLHATDSQATFCRTWSEPTVEGALEKKTIPEASGMAASIRFPDRYYWINDSGNEAVLFQTDIKGGSLKKIKISDTKFIDTESLTVTSCGNDSCVIVGDTGNNLERKRNPILYLFKEKDLEGTSTKPFRKVEFTYPDGPHDVEAMAALPDGRLIFINKELSLTVTTEPEIFTLDKADWLEGTGKPQAKLIGHLPIRQWLPDRGFLGTAVTDAAVNAARGVLGVLTYSAIVETPLEKLKEFSVAGAWQEGRDFSLVPIKALKQQESLTYDLKGARVIWSSEFYPPATPIYSQTCERSEY